MCILGLVFTRGSITVNTLKALSGTINQCVLSIFKGHYVIVSLLKNKDLVKSQETRTQSGHIPVWNQPFLFDLPGDNVNDYSFDFVVMRGKFRTKDGVVGHVVVGEDSTRDGTKHWKDILSPRPSETVRWHTIMPVFNFKSKIEPSKLNTRKDS